MTTFKYCPFCGGQPALSDAEWKDHNRFIEKELTCCAVVMKDSIAWATAKALLTEEIERRLTESLAVLWNDR